MRNLHGIAFIALLAASWALLAAPDARGHSINFSEQVANLNLKHTSYLL
jgi:hypothetical protein